MKTHALAALLLLHSLTPPLLAESVTLTPSMDAHVSEADPDLVYATTNLMVGKSSGNAWESFLHFDLSDIPTNAEITAAELHPTSSNFGSGTTLRLSRPDTGWAETRVTWTNRPTATALADIGLTLENANSAYLALTAPVPGHLQDVVRSASPNRGLKLEFPAATAEQLLTFSSRESANPPQLVITYIPGPELPDFTANLTSLDDRLRAEMFRAPEEAPKPFDLVWNTKPGVRYRLWESPDMDDWTPVPGYPIEADALGAVHEIDFTPPARFFQVEVIDEQPPEIASRFPEDGAFGIKRFYPGDEIAIRLSDITGVDPASISMSVGSLGTFGTADDALSYADGLLTLDLGGDTALGAFGAEVAVSLTVADLLGNSASYDWAFELEREMILVDGLFTFGSPDAQRAGQRVPPIPTRVLAERAGGGGPIRMNDAAWTLESVNADSLVIAYTGASAPAFAIDQYLTNMTPAHVDEIFYRKVTSINDNAAGKKLTLGTVDVPAYEVMVDGSISLGEDDIAFLSDADGRIIRAYAMRATSASEKHKLAIRPIQVNWAGKSIMGLYEKNSGSTGARFGLPIDGKDPLGNDWQAKINLRKAMLRISPTISLSTEMSFLGGIEKFWSEARIDVDAALEPEFEFLSAGIGYTMAAEDKAGEPLFKHDFHVPLGTSPLWVTISPRLQAEASLSAGLSGKASVGASGGYGKTMIFDYEKGRTPDALEIRAGAGDFHFDLIEPEISLGGTVGAEFKLIPELDVKLLSAVGFYVNVDPTLGANINADFSSGSLVSADAGVGYDGSLTAGLSVVGIDNTLLPSFQPWEIFSWESRWYFPESLVGAPLAILIQPQDQVVQPGGTIQLAVQANHSEGVSYEWRHNGRRLFNDAATLRVHDASTSASGDYSVTVRHGGDTLVSEVARVTVGNLWSGAFSEKISAGGSHSLFVKADGTLWGMGENWTGQLGDGTTTQRLTPVQIASGVAHVSAGGNHSLFVKVDGTLWGMGENWGGQLGDGTTTQRVTPMQIASGVTQVSAGFIHSLYVKTDGTLWGMGQNWDGQLGDGTTTQRLTPVQIASEVLLTSAGTTSTGLENGHSLYTSYDGRLWGMGENSGGQLGDGITPYKLSPVLITTGL